MNSTWVRLFIGLLVGFCLSLGYLLWQNRPVAPGSEEVRRDLRTLLDQQVEAWNRGDLDGFMSAYWKDPELTFFSGGDVRKGYDALQRRYRQRYQADGKEMGKLTFSDLDIQVHGEAAMIRGRWQVVMTKETIGGLFTLLLTRQGKEWKIIHDHTSQAEK